VTDPAGSVTRLERLPDGALTRVVDPTGVVTRFTTDKAGLPVAVQNAFGDVTAVVRDSAGRVRQLTDPAGAVTSFEWNADGLMLSRSGPDGARTQWQHDADGRLLREINPVGATMVYEPGPLGTLLSRTSPDGVRHTFTYDSEMRLREILNPSGASWRYEYDGAGRLVHETDFIGRTLAYRYDPNGRLTSRTTGAGQQIGLEFDRAGRLATRRTPEGDFRYDYNTDGTLASLTGPGSTLAFQYDHSGRMLAETIDGRTTRYSYDAAGRRLSRTTPSGAESTWSYDQSGRPVGLATGSGSLSFVFDTAGREIERHFGREAWLSHQYDAAGRPVQQLLSSGAGAGAGSSDDLLSREWIWRQDGVPTEIRDSVRGTRQIGSDAAGRVTTVSAAGWSETYAYDVFGNVASQGAPGAAGTPGTPDAATDALAAPADDHGPALADRTLIRRHGRTHLDHDAAGRLVRTVRRTLDGRRQIWEYTWDSADRLVQVATPDRGTWRYTYDPIGRRTAKYRLAEDGTATDEITFSWDGVRLAEQSTLDADGVATTLTWDYDPGTFRPAAQRRRTGPAGGSQDEVDEAFWGIVTDLVGTPTELVGADGHVAWQTTASLWGRTTSTVADPGVDCPLRFPGQYHDPETGLYYNLQRYYDPDTAGYLSPDPWGVTPSPNDHAYVGNPFTSIDPLGLYESIALGLSKKGELAKWADANGHHNYMDLERDDALASVRNFANERPDKDIHIVLDGFRMHSGKAGTLQEVFEDFYKRGHISQPWLTTQREMNIVGESIRLENREWSTLHFWHNGVEVTDQMVKPDFTALRAAAEKL
jgi:RHS repeat-associated protein